MFKKGQVTIFIVMAVILLVGMAFVLFLDSPETIEPELEQTLALDSDAAAVKLFVEGCLEQTAMEANQEIGLKGGFYQLPPNFIYQTIEIPVYHSTAFGNITPSIEQVENQISLLVGDEIQKCFGNFESFSYLGNIEIDSNPEITTTLRSDTMIVNMDSSLTIKKGDITTQFDTFSTTIPSRFVEFYGYALEYMESQVEDPNFLKVSHLIDLSYHRPFAYMLIYSGDNVIFSFYDNSTQDPYMLNFAVDYDWSHLQGYD